MFRSFFIIMAMALLVLFYAYTGVILFGMVRYGQAVSKHVNFRSGAEALVVLFRSLTGEGNIFICEFKVKTQCLMFRLE